MKKLLNRVELVVVCHLMKVAELVVSTRRQIKVTRLTEDECDREGLPEGHVEKDVFAFPIKGQPRWYVAAWDEGDCVVAKVLGWRLEVHYVPATGIG